MKAPEQEIYDIRLVELTGFIQRLGRGWVARCGHCVASGVNSPRSAAERAAEKYLHNVALKLSREVVSSSVTLITDAFFVVHATLSEPSDHTEQKPQ